MISTITINGCRYLCGGNNFGSEIGKYNMLSTTIWLYWLMVELNMCVISCLIHFLAFLFVCGGSGGEMDVVVLQVGG